MAIMVKFIEIEGGQKMAVYMINGINCVSLKPFEIEIKDCHGKRQVYSAAYSKVNEIDDHSWNAISEIETAAGNHFTANDRYSVSEDEITVSRVVGVERRSALEVGFGSSFEVSLQNEERFEDEEFFIPGMWYRKNENVVDKAFGSRREDHDYCARITRMALPYVECYSPEKQAYLVIKHLSPRPAVPYREIEAGWLIDEEFQYASLGIRKRNGSQLRYIFPGSEGERNYIDEREQWARRSHPIKNGVKHTYSFVLTAGSAENADDAMKDVWRRFYESEAPVHIKTDYQTVYKDGIDVLNVYCQNYNGAMGIPFWATVPEGTVCDISFQMGFVGQQTMCAYQLMRYGGLNHQQDLIKKADSVIDFWVDKSTEKSVIPQVWYNAFPDTFKDDYPTYTRTVSDGMEGILACCQWKLKTNEMPEKWFTFCKKYADWMVMNQNIDGSWYRAYDQKGQVVHKGKFNTSNPIRFMVNMYWMTREERYRESALKAGCFCLDEITAKLQYVGGTADNDNTIDKEAGMIAFYAFMALYEMSKEQKFLEAACKAADFCETWTYSWSFDVKPFKGNAVFDKVNITGLSLIATGHSHSDVMMGYMPVEYFKLWLLTGDAHYLEFCRFLNGNTKQTTDWARRFGHVYPGLVEESGELALQYHNGLGRWLPWCTIAEIESLTRFEELLGEMDVEKLILQDADELRKKLGYDSVNRYNSSWMDLHFN